MFVMLHISRTKCLILSQGLVQKCHIVLMLIVFTFTSPYYMSMQRKEAGFAHLAIVVIFLVALVGVVGYSAYRRNTNQPSTNDYSTNQPSTGEPSISSGQTGTCTKAKVGAFTSDLTDMDLVTTIQNPIRLVGGSNIKTHSYIEVSKRAAVYAPKDTTLNGGANYYETIGENPVTKVQYLLAFDNGCDVQIWLDHIVDVPDKIKNAFPSKASNDTKAVEVKETKISAGELVGYTNQTGRARFDFGVLNLKGPETSLTTNPKYKDDPIVKTSDKDRHAICPFSLYDSTKLEKYKSFYDPNTDSDQAIIDNICD